MNSQYVIEIKNRGWRTTFSPLPFTERFTVGGAGADIAVPGCKQNLLLSVSSADDLFLLHVQEGVIKEVGADHANFAVGSDAHYHIVDKQLNSELVSITFHAESKKVAPEYNLHVDIPDDRKIFFGTDSGADIVVRHSLLRGSFVSMQKVQVGWKITPICNIPMGLYLNAVKITGSTEAHAGDFVECVGLHIYLQENHILIATDDSAFVRTLHYEKHSEGEHHLEYPCINRTARIMQQIPDEEFQVQDPPAVPNENKGNLLISLLPTVAMILLTIFLRGSHESNMQMILFSTLSLSVGAVSSVLTYIYTGSQQKKQTATRKSKYLAYIENCRKQISQIRAKENRISNEQYSDCETQIQQVETFAATLFDRRKTDADFLDIRLGYGRKKAKRRVVYKAHDSFETMDDLFQLPGKLAREFEYIDNMPICVSGREANAIGVIGDVPQLKQYLNVMTLDLVTRQCYDDIHMHYVLSETYYNEMHAWRLLPHAGAKDSVARNLAFDQESRTAQLEALYKELSERYNSENSIDVMPWLVVFVDADQHTTMQHPLFKYVPNAAQVHVLFIFFSMFQDLLPQGCSSIIRLMNNVNAGIVSLCVGTDDDALFEYEQVDNAVATQVAVKLAPVYSWDTKLAAHLSGNETLFDMLQIHSVTDVDIVAQWKKADTTVGLAAPLGIRDDGSILELDLHEGAHGPHGLVAGMTGSGKSQVLISYLLSLAASYSPEDITFAVIDFKGGDIVKQLAGLPHIVGSITNIEKGEIARSLRAINAEKNKRMVLFDEEHANVSNIFAYTKAYKAGKVSIPLPHLLIIVDEFAELKSQYPDFMQELISIARVGRSLGIHLVLCTQKPAGVIDAQIWSNSNFHLCLRVQNHEDSNEVLHSPLAAEIREPGRGYLQVEHQLFELFQSGYSGGTEVMASAQTDKSFTISQIDIAGRTETLYSHQAKKAASGRTQREALLEQIIMAFENSGLTRPEQLCMPPIPACMEYDETAKAPLFKIPIGIYDDPDTQSIHTLTIDISGRNTLIVGGSQIGKTNLLLSIIRRVCSTMSVKDCAMYAMDFNVKAIKAMESLCSLGGVVTDDEEEKLKSLLRLLKQEIGNRKSLFAQNDARTFAAYHEMRHDLPAIIVMIDNYAVFHDLYEEAYGEELLILMREGPAYGISFIVTVQQMASMTYKKPYYFAERIVLPLSEQTEYSTILDGCRMTLPDIPGRVLVKIDKQIYQGQTYEAFSGKNEADRTNAIHEFVAAHAQGVHVKAIPCVPDVLTKRYLLDNYPDVFMQGVVPCAMEYDAVHPVCIDMNERGLICVISNDENRKRSFTKQIIRRTLTMKLRLYIFDSYYRPLKEFRGHPGVTRYSTSEADLENLFTNLGTQLLTVNSQSEHDDLQQPVCTAILINSYELIKHISDNILLMEQFKSFMDNARKLNVFFMFCEVPNKPTKYTSPELLQYIAEEKQAIIFSDLNTVKAISIDFPTIRENSRPLAPDEAFVMNGDDITRVKMCTD